MARHYIFVKIALIAVISTFAAPSTVRAQGRPAAVLQLDTLEQLFRSGQYGPAIALGNQIDNTLRKAVGENSRDYGAYLNIMAAAYGGLGQTREADSVLRRALLLFERMNGPRSTEVAVTLNNLGENAKRSGRPSDAIDYFRRALVIQESRNGVNATVVATILNSIGGTYIDVGRFQDAENVLRRALQIWRKAPRTNPVDVSRPLVNLALIYNRTGRRSEAESIFKQAIALKQQALGPNHPDLITPLNNLADLYSSTDRPQEAVQLLKQSLSITDALAGINSPISIPTLANLGNAYAFARDIKNADQILQRLLNLQRISLGADHTSVALTLHNLAVIRMRSGQTTESLSFSREAVRIASAELRNGKGQTLLNVKGFLETNLAILDEARRGPTPGQHAEEAFEVAQKINESTAAAALNQLSARFGVGDNDLAKLVRAQQDAISEQSNLDAALVSSISSAGPRNTSQEAIWRRRLTELASAISSLEKQLSGRFPTYSSLANQKPLSANDVQALLQSEEALIYLYPAETELHVFTVTTKDINWNVVPVGRQKLLGKVGAFRKGLDIDAAQKSVTDGKPDLFDLAGSNALYQLLFGSDALIRDKRHLVIVPTGSLTALPFNLLVTSPGTNPVAGGDPLSAYRNADWIIKRSAISILPSVASLSVVRVTTARSRAPKPIIGFGDPVFGGQDDGRTNAAQRSSKRLRRSADIPFSEFWKGAGVDRNKLSTALPRLADTADELDAIAARLKAKESIFLGVDATEAAVKRAPLSDYRIVYFATHSLVSGDVKGVGEPSLALSIPAQPTTLDDGLLTSSEVAQLSLNADWVVLSACNTVSGDTPSAEGLSGLVRAFFYAGARSLLVTHWAVLSSAATTLTTSTFDALATEPKLGRAEALQRAMLRLAADPTDPWYAYPAVWAPFELVGAN